MNGEKKATINDDQIHFSDILIAQSLNKHFFFKHFVCVEQKVKEELQYGEFLKLLWSDFHLSFLGGEVMSFPVEPVDTISV